MKPIRVLLALAFLFGSASAFAADLTITAANVKTTDNTTEVSRVRFGETVTQGQALYRKTTDGKYYKADADHATAENAAASAICLTPGATGEYGYVVTEGLVTMGATLVVGEIYCVSDVAGGVRPEGDNGTGDRVTILGVATTSSVLWLKPFASGTAVP